MTQPPPACFSALQRAENSSIDDKRRNADDGRVFQCSSASRKFLNERRQSASPSGARERFSALQRAENSSIRASGVLDYAQTEFQCSSASRKFLNSDGDQLVRTSERMFQCSSASRKFLNDTSSAAIMRLFVGFSALQRAENSSISSSRRFPQDSVPVSVLFSEPKIPQSDDDNSDPQGGASFSALQRAENSSISPGGTSAVAQSHVSVLFSEPKIPQSLRRRKESTYSPRFQCSSASRKFLNTRETIETLLRYIPFQCSSASRKFLNRAGLAAPPKSSCVSVLFSEPKIPQSTPR